MKRLAVFMLLSALILALTAAAGCGQKKASLVTPEGEVTIDVERNRIVIATEEGKSEWSSSSGVTEKQLGVPVPSGARMDKQTAGSVTLEKGAGAGEKWLGAVFWTSEETDRVIDWYRVELEKMPGVKDDSLEMEGRKIGMFQVAGKDAIKTVIVMAGEKGDPGRTMINIAVAEGVEGS